MSNNYLKTCQYCQSEIPQLAQKCKYCLEWQEEEVSVSSSPHPDISFESKFPHAKKPFQFKIVERIPLNYAVSAFIIGAIIFGIVQLTWYKLDEDKIYLWSYLAFSLQLIISWAGLIWVYKLINDHYSSFVNISSSTRNEAEVRFIKFHSLVFHNGYAALTGVGLGLIASIGDYLVGTPFKSFEAKMVFAVFEFINMFISGAAIYSIVMFAYFLHITSKDPNKEILRLDKNNGVSNIGNVHLKSALLAIVPLFLGVIAKLFGSWSWDFLIILWYGSFAVIIIIYIYWPMLNIHRMMREDVESQVSIIQKKIQTILVEINSNPSSRNLYKLNELRKLEKSVSDQNTWPFDSKNISAIFFAIILPIILMAIDRIWSI